MLRTALKGAPAATLAVILSNAAHGDVRDWQPAGGGVFGSAANWLPADVPDGNDTARFDLGASYVVTFGQNRTTLSLLVDDDDVTLDLGGWQYTAQSTVIGDGPGHLGELTLVDGTLAVPGGPALFLSIGSAADAVGRITVSTGATLTCQADANIGDDGSGVLTIVNGGAASMPLTFLGDNPGAEGTVVVDGAGSSWTVTGELFVGNAGDGMLSVTDGGVAMTSRVKVGDEPGAVGTALVDGVGSLWDDAVELIVGNHGVGDLTISGGGAVTGLLGVIGDDPGSDGTVRVTGAGSLLQITQTLRIGRSGASKLVVTEGGDVAADTIRLGGATGPTAKLKLDGGGSTVTANDLLKIGATGRLEITLGAANGTITATGTADLDGTLVIAFADGYEPEPGDAFDLITAGAVTGTFDSVSTPQGFKLSYAADRVSLEVEAAFVTGETAGDDFGGAVASVGDLDGDGTDDFVVGAPLHDAVGDDAGRVYVYSGADLSLLYAIDGEQAGDRFGWSVAAAGDVDGDTFGDFLAGAPRNDGGGDDAGRAYVISGFDGTTLDTYTGEAAGDSFGWSVAGAGDVDRDGDLDFLIGAPKNDELAKNAGKVYVHSEGTLVPVHTFLGEVKGDKFGWSVAVLVRAGGTSPGDLVVGAPFNDEKGSKAGKVYVYSGAGYPLFYTLRGKNAGDRFGHVVASAGCIDADDLDELAVAAPFFDKTGVTDGGRVDVYSGLTGVRLWKKKGGDVAARLGWSLAGAGDVDGDGTPDLVVGAPWRQNQKGRAFVWSGVDGSAVSNLKGSGAGSRMGSSVAGAGDLDGDGRAEVLLGAPDDGAGEIAVLFSP